MSSIIVPVAELLKLSKELKADGMEYVELSILESEVIDDDTIPACLWASGIKTSMPNFQTDYESIDAVTDLD